MKVKKKLSEILTPEEMDKIKEAYLNHMQPSTIARKFNVNRTTLYNYIKKSWRQERDLIEIKHIQEFTNSKKPILTRLSESSIIIISRALEKLASRKEAPTVMEARTATTIFKEVDTILRLDDGRPTDIIEEKLASVKEIKKRMELDPFLIEEEDVVQEN